ncbi:MAG: cupin domain-containing protein [Verrucomicrobia bacterium]|nr:cupin domain-containing protein [Verrucomicrobiota bacterium]
MKTFLLAVLMSGLCLASVCGGEKAPAKPAVCATHADQIPAQEFPWGTLKWVCNEKLALGAQQTLGLASILPGHGNPIHFHPNCEEVLYVLSGCGTHSSDGQTIELKPGMTLCIPAGVKHKLTNTGVEPLKTLISFSSGDRKTVFLEANPPK